MIYLFTEPLLEYQHNLRFDWLLLERILNIVRVFVYHNLRSSVFPHHGIYFAMNDECVFIFHHVRHILLSNFHIP